MQIKFFNRWTIGFIFSCIFAWVCAYFFLENLHLYEWNSRLEKYAIAEGNVHYHRSEGWATTITGKYSIPGVANIERASSKVIIWGNSFVEGFQVSDNDKMANQVTSMCKIMAIPVARSAGTVADVYFQLPIWEKIVGNTLLCHFIVISHINYTLPDADFATMYQFRSSPQLAFFKLPRVHPQKYPKLIQHVKKLRLDFLYEVGSRLKKRVSQMRWTVGPTSSKEKKQKLEEISETITKWKFLLSKLKQRTTLPIIFIYLPEVPTINKHRISTVDHEQHVVSVFAKLCEEEGFYFVNLRQSFVSFYDKKQIFPRGFATSRPAKGHLNKHGHKIVAREIVAFLQKFVSRRTK